MTDLKNGPSLVPAEPCLLSDDILRGAEDIAEFLFGDRRQRRRVYHVASTSNLPCFRLGSILCARRSKLLEWIEKQEDRNVGAA